MADQQRYRVVQWATGVVGSVALKAIIEHPQMDLVGVYVYSAAKEGQDAGALCGLPPVGIAATRDIGEIIAAKPDCVVYMPESTNLDDVCRLLESGINITTTRTEFYNPDGIDPAVRDRVQKACVAGNSAIHASGSSPGFITEALPIVLTSITRRLDFLMIDEYANCLGGVVSPEMLTTTMGFGDTPEAFAKRDIAKRDEGFEYSLGVFADAIGLPIERFETTGEVATARQPITIGAVTIEPGQVAAQRISVTAFHAGTPLMRFRANWYVSDDVDPKWDLPPDSGWRVIVEGDTPLNVAISFPVAAEHRVQAFSGLTAYRPVNAVASVCAAPPGMATTVSLPRVTARFGEPKPLREADRLWFEHGQGERPTP